MNLERLLACAGVTLLSLLSPAALAKPRPAFDAFTESTADVPLTDALSEQTRGLVELGNVTHFERRLGVPTFFWPSRDEVTKRSVKTLGVVAGPTTPTPPLPEIGVTPEQAARRILFQYAELYRFNPTTLAAVPVSLVHNIGTGVVIVEFRRDIGGVPVFRDSIKVAMNQRLEPIAISGYLSPFTTDAQGQLPTFTLPAENALQSAFRDLTDAEIPTAAMLPGTSEGGWQWFNAEGTVTADGSRVARALRSRKVLFPHTDGLEAAYHVELEVTPPGATTSSEFYAYVISARDGGVLFRKNLSAADGYRVWADPVTKIPYDGPQASAATPHPTASVDGTQPPFVAPSLITLTNFPFSKNDPWLPANATVTRGNNVNAYADIATPDHLGAGDLQPTTTAAATFDRTYDLNAAPRATQNQSFAAVTQLFYNVNFFHDWYYDVGFDEAARNGQDNNLGRGGVGNDAMLAEAQDFSGTNNANMQTPADGSRPIMQMYVFDGTAPRSVKMTAPSARDFQAGAAEFGAPTFTLSGNVALAVDGTAPANDGCTAYTTQVTGRIALVDRGTCDFVVKMNNARAAGATGVLVVDNAPGSLPPGMSGTAAAAQSIPTLSLTQADGAVIKSALAAGQAVTVTLTRAAATQRDGALDNAIVAHEWGHFISNRLIGNSVGLTGAQGDGMGEGVSDFHAMLMVVREEDATQPANANFNGVYGLAGYSQAGSGPGYYFGIRRVPYSTDMTKNGLTLRHIANGQALPATVPTLFGLDGAQNAEVHNSGEVYATMMWEAYAALLRSKRLTFAEAQLRMRQYTVGMYKLCPNTPTMLEMRDALLATVAAKDLEDFEAVAQAFAKRGAGRAAKAPDRASTTNTPVTENFDASGDLSMVAPLVKDDVSSCDMDGQIDAGETGTLTVTVKNTGWTRLSSTTGTVSSTTPGVTFPGGATITFGTVLPNGTATGSVKVALAKGATGIVSGSFAITVTDPKLASATGRSSTFPVQLNVDMTTGTPVADAGNKCVNRAPVAVGTAELTVTSGETVKLDSSGSFDADNDAITATWTQTGGPQVSLQGNQFIAPNVQEPATLGFQLVVSDGKTQSLPFTTKVTVKPGAGAGVEGPGGVTNGGGPNTAGGGNGATGVVSEGEAVGSIGCSQVPSSSAAWALGLMALTLLASRSRRGSKKA